MLKSRSVESKLERLAARAEGKAEGAALAVTEIRRWYGASSMPLALEQRLNKLLTELGAENVAAVRSLAAHCVGEERGGGMS
jgi:hypothetical protein